MRQPPAPTRLSKRRVLAPIYGWFIQGFDTPDLSQAGTLLGELRWLQQ